MSLWSRLFRASTPNDDDPTSSDTAAPQGAPTRSREGADPIDRAEFFRHGLRSLGRAASAAATQVSDRIQPRAFRPPGALEELAFLTTCTRCNRCADACPHDAIVPLGPHAKLAANTPALDPNNGRACHACADQPCARACPVGALRVLPVAQWSIGTATLNRDTCLAWDDAPCTVCLRNCPLPHDAILLDPSTQRVYIDPRRCVGCGLCALSCPTAPSSITLTP